MLQTKKTWRRCCSVSIMNLEHLIFTWKGRLLVLALFASIIMIKNKIINLNIKTYPKD